MKILAPIAFASIVLVSACASSPQDKVNAQMPLMASSTSSVHNYRCVSGEVITIAYPSTDSATVKYKGNNYLMKIAVSASGARYIGGELEWWTKGFGSGSEGTLFRHLADGTSGDSIEHCTES